MIYLSNSFSLSMVGEGHIEITAMSADDVALSLAYAREDRTELVSVVGHADVARIMSAQLDDMDVAVNRVSIAIREGDDLYVAQYVGPRLPEGATALPDGATLAWRRVRLVPRPANAEELDEQIRSLRRQLFAATSDIAVMEANLAEAKRTREELGVNYGGFSTDGDGKWA